MDSKSLFWKTPAGAIFNLSLLTYCKNDTITGDTVLYFIGCDKPVILHMPYDDFIGEVGCYLNDMVL